MPESKLFNLDAMRGLAALFVFVRHTEEFWGKIGLHHSYLAVDIFFVLSGFVIAHAYEKRFINRTLDIKNFIVIRLIRLYPMYFLGLLIGLSVAASKLYLGENLTLIRNDALLSTLLLSILFLPTHLNPGQTLFPLNPPSWSLFYELVVNIIYGFIRKYLNIYILLSLLAFSLMIVCYASYKTGGLDIGAMAGAKSMFGSFTRSFFGIFFGVALYKVHKRGVNIPSWLNIQLAPLIIMCLIFITPHLGQANWIFDVICVSVILRLCVLWAANVNSNLLPVKYCLFLGIISYPLYVIHKPLAELFGIFFSQQLPHTQPIGGLILLAVTLGLSVLLVRFIDEPVRKQMSKTLVHSTKVQPNKSATQ